MQPLAAALWTGPLADPAAPGRALAARIGALDYSEARAELRVLTRLALPCEAALEAALARWPWSVDLGWLAWESRADLAPLTQAVHTQKRRYGTLAWGLWQARRRDEALAVLERLDPRSESHDEDRLARAELSILADHPAEPLPGPRGARLSLLATWRQEGAAALAQRVEHEGAALPAHAALWSWLVDVFITERDFTRARAALSALVIRCGAERPETQAQTIRLTLEAGETAAARALLDAQPGRESPWLWPARRHVQHLRCLADEIAVTEAPDHAPLIAAATAALRLHPRNGALQGLRWSARELTQEWDALAEEAAREDPPRLGALIRLGHAERAASLASDAEDAPLRRAEALLRLGRIAEAVEALGPAPTAAPARADWAYWRAEIALAARDQATARAVLGPALAACPTRMGLVLSAARCAFLEGEFEAAEAWLVRFRALKTAQLGQPEPEDLRDKITRDALAAQAEGRGPERSPGLAAQRFARACPPFEPAAAAIPARIAHYWEGPRSAPVERGLTAWARALPQRLFDAAGARTWLEAQDPALAALFDRLTAPAARADLFRVAWIAREGGVFADLDEFPRQAITSWLAGARAVLVIEEGHGTIANNFLAARAETPLFQRLEARISTNLSTCLARGETPYPWWESGPAALTLEAWRAAQDPAEAAGLRFLTQPEYDARIATNLPFPHKRGPGHWR